MFILGGIILGMNAKGNRLQHWSDTIKSPGQAHSKIHYLSANYIDWWWKKRLLHRTTYQNTTTTSSFFLYRLFSFFFLSKNLISTQQQMANDMQIFSDVRIDLKSSHTSCWTIARKLWKLKKTFNWSKHFLAVLHQLVNLFDYNFHF